MTGTRILQSSWPTVPLGTLLIDIQPGFASGIHNSTGEGIPHLRPMNISTAGFIDRSVLKYVDPALASRPERQLKSGDVLFNNTNSPELVGKTALFVENDVPAFSNHMTRLRTDTKKLDPGYLAMRLHFAWMCGYFAEHCNNHVSQASIGRQVLKDFMIELPPLNVQISIRKILEKVGDKQKAASTHLTAVRGFSEHFRQSVLTSACSGRLTMNWREEHGDMLPANGIVERIKQHRQARLGQQYRSPASSRLEDELPATWCWTTVGAQIDVATGATPLRKRSDYYGGTIPWVTSGAVNAGLITDASEYITEQAIRETNAKVFPSGTLLVAMYGEGQTRGRVAELGIAAATNQAVAALLFNEDNEFLRPYVKLFFLENYERIRMQAFGGVQPNLSLGVIRDTLLPLPPENEQREIVQRVGVLLKLAADLEQRINTAMNRIERSSQAVLAKAFRGELKTNASEEQNTVLAL